MQTDNDDQPWTISISTYVFTNSTFLEEIIDGYSCIKLDKKQKTRKNFNTFCSTLSQKVYNGEDNEVFIEKFKLIVRRYINKKEEITVGDIMDFRNSSMLKVKRELFPDEEANRNLFPVFNK